MLQNKEIDAIILEICKITGRSPQTIVKEMKNFINLSVLLMSCDSKLLQGIKNEIFSQNIVVPDNKEFLTIISRLDKNELEKILRKIKIKNKKNIFAKHMSFFIVYIIFFATTIYIFSYTENHDMLFKWVNLFW